jgi:hypothetical protein
MISFSLRRSGLSRGGGICFVVGLHVAGGGSGRITERHDQG